MKSMCEYVQLKLGSQTPALYLGLQTPTGSCGWEAKVGGWCWRTVREPGR